MRVSEVLLRIDFSPCLKYYRNPSRLYASHLNFICFRFVCELSVIICLLFMYRICRNKRPPRNKYPPNTVIFQRGEYTKPMGFDGWFFKGGSTQNRWALMGDFSKGGVHKTDGLWWVIFQRGEYTKPMGFDEWFFKGGSTQNRWVLEFFYCFEKLSARGVYLGKYGIWDCFLWFIYLSWFICLLSIIHLVFSTYFDIFFSTFECDCTQGGRYPHADQRWPSTRRRPSNRRGRAASCRQHCPPAT